MPHLPPQTPPGFKAERSQAEVAAILGVSRGRVYQIERKALAKLRPSLLLRLGPQFFDNNQSEE